MTNMEHYKLELRTQERRTRVTEFEHLSSVIFQRDQLAQSLHGLLKALGVCNEDTSPNGAELLMFAEEAANRICEDMVQLEEVQLEETEQQKLHPEQAPNPLSSIVPRTRL